MAAPQLDKRKISDIEATAKALAALPAYTPEWTGLGKPDDPGWQVVGLFARMMELLIERLNKVPEKNFMEFLDLVGVEPSPGNAAAVPVTFLLSNKAPAGGEIPAGTQLATTQTEAADAQIFETRSAFFATPAKLAASVDLLPEGEFYRSLPVPTLPPDPAAIEPDPTTAMILSVAEPTLTPVDHVLYLDQPTLFARAEPVDITLTFALTGDQKAIFDAAHLEWRIYSAEMEDWIEIPIPALYDLSTANQATVTLPALEGAAPVEVDGVEAVWLAGHFKSAADTSLALPTITNITGTFAPVSDPGDPTAAPQTTIQAAFSNTLLLDFSKPVYPFGQRPKYGDAFYVGHDLAFAPDVEGVILQLTLRDYPDAELEAMFDGLIGTEQILTKLEWQYRATDGQWKPLPIDEFTNHTYEHTVTFDSTSSDPIDRNTAGNSDHGALFRSDVSLDLDIPDDIERGKVGEIETYWLRAIVLSEGPYGKEGFLFIVPAATSTSGDDEFYFIGPTFVPPVIESATITYQHRAEEHSIERVKALNNFELIDRTAGLDPTGPGIQPFTRLTDPTSDIVAAFDGDPALYLGFDRKFGNIFVSLFLHLEEIFDAEQPQLESGDPQVVWEYLAEGMVWKPLDVADETAHLTSSGSMAFQGPADSISASLFPQLSFEAATLYWYRARLGQGRYDYPPRLRFVLLNSVMADNQATLVEVVAGSSNGEQNQQLTLLQRPVLEGELWVREPEIPSADEIAELEEELARQQRDADGTGTPSETIDIREPAAGSEEPAIWVRWMRRPNFLASLPRSRHYTLEPTSGLLTLGDGLQGLIPPIAKDNIVLRNMRIGGGEDANQAAAPLAVKELKTSLPFIDKVFNVQGATGGSDPWDQQQILDLGPQLIKNKQRAVTTEDFEWLVRANFSQVARVRCLATRSPAATGGLAFTPGALTLIVVPKGSERTPQPPKALLKQIVDFLRGKALGNIIAEIHAIAPEYRPVRIAATLSPVLPEDSSLVERRAVRALEDFLHPLTGGEDDAGWPFGRPVYRSEIFAVLQAVEGVDYVATATFIDDPGADSLLAGEHALVASGGHEIGVI